MTKLRTWRCLSVVMVLMLTLGVCAMVVPTSPVMAAAAAATWDIQTVDDVPAMATSLALDSNGYPHISYTTAVLNSGAHNSLHYARWTGTAWAKEMVDDVPAMATSLALDSNNRPHISYTTGGLNSLHYARWTGTAWAKETVDGGGVSDCSLALDSNNRPHISYASWGSGLLYARWTGTAWAKETVDEGDVLFNSLALDSSDYPHISYATASFGSLHYARWTGTAWAKETVDEGDVLFNSLALDSSDYPHISYATAGLLSLHYARLIPPDTATTNTATGTGTATFSTSAGGGIAKLTATAQTAITCAPRGVEFPHGLFSFNILGLNPGETVTVTITLPSPVPAGTQYWKCQNGIWIDCTSLVGDNDGDNVLTLTLTDGGLGDADGVANGTIVDPGGPAVAASSLPAGPRSSPTIPRPLNPAQMSLQYLSITPQQTSAGQPVTITTNVVNTGDEAGNYNVALKINGQLEQSRMVGVGPQGTQPVKFTVIKDQPGTYNVDILGKSGSFTILGAGSSGTTGSKTGGMIALALIGVLIIASLVVLLIRRT